MENTRVVAARLFTVASGFLNRRRRKRDLSSFVNVPNSEAYHCLQFEDGSSRLERVTDADCLGRSNDADVFARVTTLGIPCELTCSGLRDQKGTELDLVVVGTWKIKDRRAFLQEYGLERLKATIVIEVVSLENTLTECCRQAISNEMQTLTYDAMKQQDARPLPWWKTKLPQWIGADWLELVEVAEVRYESATADRAAEIERRRELLALEDGEKQRQLDRERAQKQEQAEHEEAVRDLKITQEYKEQERCHRLEELKSQHAQQVLRWEQGSEIARLEHESQKAELLAGIESARNREDAAAEVLHHSREAGERIEQRLQAIEEAQTELAVTASFAREVSQSGMPDVERLSTGVTGLSTSTMALLGRTSGAAYLSRVFREKAAASPDAVMMKKVEIRTRDIVGERVNTLAIDSPLRFEVLAQRSGYATVLNIGTSGKIHLHCPNAYVGIAQARIEAAKPYQVPGVELLPDEQLQRNNLGYWEIGPAGWEELIVVLSHEPLMTDADLFRSTPDNPFVTLSADRIDQLLNQLAELPEDGWNVGMLSFLVE